MRVEFPWPDSGLSPNARLHWTAKHGLFKRAKESAYYLTKAAGPAELPESGPILVSIEFYPPSRRRYDLDNALGRCKAILDGFASALGVDDHRFELKLKMAGIGGKVVLHV